MTFTPWIDEMKSIHSKSRTNQSRANWIANILHHLNCTPCDFVRNMCHVNFPAICRSLVRRRKMRPIFLFGKIQIGQLILTNREQITWHSVSLNSLQAFSLVAYGTLIQCSHLQWLHNERWFQSFAFELLRSAWIVRWSSWNFYKKIQITRCTNYHTKKLHKFPPTNASECAKLETTNVTTRTLATTIFRNSKCISNNKLLRWDLYLNCTATNRIDFLFDSQHPIMCLVRLAKKYHE